MKELKATCDYILPNFLITNVFPSTNKGDAAIIKSMLKQIKKAYANSEISILCIKPEKDRESLSKFGNVYGELFTFKRKLPIIIRIIEIFCKTLQYLLWTKLHFLPIDNNARFIFGLYRKADLIIGSGGGYLGGNYLQSIISTLIPMYIAKKLGKRVYYSGITIEPPKWYLLKIFTKFVLNRVDLITTREPISMNVIRSLDIKTPSYLTGDYALLLNDDSKILGDALLKDAGVPTTNKPIIGINLKSWSSGVTSNFAAKASPAEIQQYKNAFITAIERIIEQIGATVVLFPTDYSPQTDDRKISKEIKLKIKDKVSKQVFVISKEYQPEQIKSMISAMDVIIGTRFHSVLFAFLMQIPFISIRYMQKNGGLIIAFIVSLVFFILIPFLIDIFFNSYTEAIQATQIMVFAVIPMTASAIMNAKLLGREKSQPVAIAVGLRLIALLALVVILGNTFGLAGLAFSVVISSLLQSFSLLIMNKIYK